MTEAETTPTPTPSIDDTLDRVIADAFARDERGRFAPTNNNPSAEDAPVEAAPAEDEIEAGEGAAEEQPLDVPASWSEDARSVWASLPRAVQEQLATRERDAASTTEQYTGKLKLVDSINEALSPVQQRLALAGMDPAQYVRQLTAADEYLRSDPLNAINWLAKSYGIDLKQLVPPSEQQITPSDPTQNATQQAIAALQQQIQALTNSRQQELSSEINREIQAFQSNTAKYPHFEKVRTFMGGLIQSGLAKTMDEAYDSAIFANPTLRAQVLADQEKARTAEAAKKAVAARRAASINIDTSAPAVVAKKSFDDTLSAAIAKFMPR